ncbi:hypothetical protein CTAM01_17291 [Colletotrichum tamarilloi]|uniref:Uncharacterized protein n=1 Tax=Colletotrichum tamarilloi TaxID=1209934 RepID=A0ABQ9QG17_9PEZI|nr:hypothetical protein CTAM01_17291 [Colletotrichum tamarilloi]
MLSHDLPAEQKIDERRMMRQTYPSLR